MISSKGRCACWRASREFALSNWPRARTMARPNRAMPTSSGTTRWPTTSCTVHSLHRLGVLCCASVSPDNRSARPRRSAAISSNRSLEQASHTRQPARSPTTATWHRANGFTRTTPAHFRAQERPPKCRSAWVPTRRVVLSALPILAMPGPLRCGYSGVSCLDRHMNIGVYFRSCRLPRFEHSGNRTGSPSLNSSDRDSAPSATSSINSSETSPTSRSTSGCCPTRDSWLPDKMAGDGSMASSPNPSSRCRSGSTPSSALGPNALTDSTHSFAMMDRRATDAEPTAQAEATAS